MNTFEKTVMTIQFAGAAVVYLGVIYLFVQSILPKRKRMAK
jgi:hypothetical protein